MAKRKLRPGDIVCNDSHLTKQDHGGTADINYIANQYMTGKMPYPDTVPPVFADMTQTSVQEAMDTVAELKSSFDALPSDARDVFQTPLGFAEYMVDNAAEIESEGLSAHLREYINPSEPGEPVSHETESAQAQPEESATDGEPGTE